MIRRSRLEIMLDVLRIINDGTHLPTHIMFKANLSWHPLQKFLKSLIKQGFIIVEIKKSKSSEKMKKLYKITEKGKKVLKYFEGLEEIIS